MPIATFRTDDSDVRVVIAPPNPVNSSRFDAGSGSWRMSLLQRPLAGCLRRSIV